MVNVLIAPKLSSLLYQTSDYKFPLQERKKNGRILQKPGFNILN